MSWSSFPKDKYPINVTLSGDEVQNLVDQMYAISTKMKSECGKSVIERLEFLNYISFIIIKRESCTEFPRGFRIGEWHSLRVANEALNAKRSLLLDLLLIYGKREYSDDDN